MKCTMNEKIDDLVDQFMGYKKSRQCRVLHDLLRTNYILKQQLSDMSIEQHKSKKVVAKADVFGMF